MLAAIVVLSATLAAPTGVGIALAIAGVAALAVPRGEALTAAPVLLAVAVGVAIDQGAAPSGAPLWGAGLLAAAALADRALTLPPDGEVEAEALVTWLAGLATLAGCGLAAGALVLLAATSDAGTAAIGLVAGALLAVVPAVVARRRADAD